MRNHIVRQLATRRGQGQHPGLLLDRFLVAQNDNGQDKRDLFEAARAAGQSEPLRRTYRLAFQRWRTGLLEPCAAVDLATPPHARLIVGLGSKGVIEAGLRLHHTYGVPLIPGSALKGLASHYCHEVWGSSDSRYKRCEAFHNLLFGTTEAGGVIRFEDAWMHPDSQGILPDVMTPHHQTWQTDPTSAPTDFDSPVPVPFLSVAGSFCVAVCWQGPEDARAAAWTKRTLKILEEALKEWGVGGKTSSGYGRLQALAKATSSPPQPTGVSVERRNSNVPVKVTIVGPRANGRGFDVHEKGHPPGTLTLGTPTPGVKLDAGSVVDVLIHNDDLRKPQYKWPTP